MVSIVTEHEFRESFEDSMDCQNLDRDNDWQTYEPEFQWTREDLEEFEFEEKVRINEQKSLAAWWELEGVRCWTFGPPRNPYL